MSSLVIVFMTNVFMTLTQWNNKEVNFNELFFAITDVYKT